VSSLQIGSIEVLDRRAEFNGSYKSRELQDIRYLIVHHVGAADAEGNAVETETTAQQLENHHKNKLGWPGIGYHFHVSRDGTIEYVGDILTQRWNVGDLNPYVIGISMSGNWNTHRPPEVQIEAVKALCANLQYALGWFIPIYGHRELQGSATRCPGDTSIGPDGWLAYVKAGLEPRI